MPTPPRLLCSFCCWWGCGRIGSSIHRACGVTSASDSTREWWIWICRCENSGNLMHTEYSWILEDFLSWFPGLGCCHLDSCGGGKTCHELFADKAGWQEKIITLIDHHLSEAYFDQESLVALRYFLTELPPVARGCSLSAAFSRQGDLWRGPLPRPKP